jgi:hypothetical protein
LVPADSGSILSGESLSAPIVESSCSYTSYSLYASVKATGTATGPYPGTFTTSLSIAAALDQRSYVKGSVSISSGSQRIQVRIAGDPGAFLAHVQCTGSAPSILNFRLNHLRYHSRRGGARGTFSATLTNDAPFNANFR